MTYAERSNTHEATDMTEIKNCIVIRTFLTSWGADLEDDETNRLTLPLVSRAINSGADETITEQRGYMALDWLIRVYTPQFLKLSLPTQAEALRKLDEITDLNTASAAGHLVQSVSTDAQEAVNEAVKGLTWDEQWDAPLVTSRKAVERAGGVAAWEAARCVIPLDVRNAFGAEAGTAARDGAWAAATSVVKGRPKGEKRWEAVRDFLELTVNTLQESAGELVERMRALSDDAGQEKS